MWNKFGGVHEHDNYFDIFSDRCGNVYASDRSNSCIRVFSNDGKFLRSLGCDRNGVQRLKTPSGGCVAGQYVYVPDIHEGENNVVVFTTEGDYVSSFGRVGGRLCVDQDGFVYVCNFENWGLLGGKKMIGSTCIHQWASSCCQATAHMVCEAEPKG